MASLIGLYGVPYIPKDVSPYRFDMQRNKVSSFAIARTEHQPYLQDPVSARNTRSQREVSTIMIYPGENNYTDEAG